MKNCQQDLSRFKINIELFPILFLNKMNLIYIHLARFLHHGSSFKETTLDCLLRFATLTKTTERHDGAHHGLRTFCSPFRQATFIRLSSLQSVMKSPHFIWHRRINRRICSVVNMDMPSRYSPLTPFSLKI